MSPSAELAATPKAIKAGAGVADIKFKVEEEIVIQHMSRLYGSAYSVLRELFTNEEAACMIAAREAGFDHGSDCRIELEYYPAERRLFIRGVNSLGIDTQTLNNVLRYYGRSLNRLDAEAGGRFGMGFKGFVQLTTSPDEQVESGYMLLRTHSRKTGERYSLLCTPRGFKYIDEEVALEEPGTELEVVHRSDLDPSQVVSTLEKQVYLSPVRVYLTVEDERDALPPEEYRGQSFYRSDGEKPKPLCLTKERRLLSQHSVEDLVEGIEAEAFKHMSREHYVKYHLRRDVGGGHPAPSRHIETYTLKLHAPGYEAAAKIVARIKNGRPDFGPRGSAHFALVGRPTAELVLDSNILDSVWVNFRREDVVEPTPDRDDLDQEQLKKFTSEVLLPELLRKAREAMVPQISSIEEFLAARQDMRERWRWFVLNVPGASEQERELYATLSSVFDVYSYEGRCVGKPLHMVLLGSTRDKRYYTDKFYRDQCNEYVKKGAKVVRVDDPETLEWLKSLKLGFSKLPKKRSKPKMNVTVHFRDPTGKKVETETSTVYSLPWERMELVMITPDSGVKLSNLVNLLKLGGNPIDLGIFNANKTQAEEVMAMVEGDPAMRGKVYSPEELLRDVRDTTYTTSMGELKGAQLLGEAQRDIKSLWLYDTEADHAFFASRMNELWRRLGKEGTLLPLHDVDLVKFALAARIAGVDIRVRKHLPPLSGGYRLADTRWPRQGGKGGDLERYAEVMMSRASAKIVNNCSSKKEAVAALEAMDPVFLLKTRGNGLLKAKIPGLAAVKQEELVEALPEMKSQELRDYVGRRVLTDEDTPTKALEGIAEHCTGEVKQKAEAMLVALRLERE